MASQYLIKLSSVPGDTRASLKLIATIPQRVLRMNNAENIKRYVATQHNLSYEQIDSFEPFYRA